MEPFWFRWGAGTGQPCRIERHASPDPPHLEREPAMDGNRDRALTWGGVGCVAARTVWLVVLYGHPPLPTQGRRASTPFGTAAAGPTGGRTAEPFSV